MLMMSSLWQSIDNAAVVRRSPDGVMEAFADLDCQFPLTVDYVDPFGDVCAWPALGLKYASRDHGALFRVFLNCVDVSTSCLTADDRFGYVVLIERNEHGNAFLRHHPQCPNRDAGDKVRFYFVENPEPDPENPSRQLVAMEAVPCHSGCGVASRLEVGDVVIVPWGAVKDDEADARTEGNGAPIEGADAPRGDDHAPIEGDDAKS